MKMIRISVLCVALSSAFGLFAMECGGKRVKVANGLDKIVDQFLHSPQEYKKLWGSSYKDVSKMIARELMEKIALSSWLCSEVITSKFFSKVAAWEHFSSAVFNKAGDRVLVRRTWSNKLLDEKGVCIAELTGIFCFFNNEGDKIVSVGQWKENSLLTYNEVRVHEAQSGELVDSWVASMYIHGVCCNKKADKILITGERRCVLLSFDGDKIEEINRGWYGNAGAVPRGEFSHNGDTFIIWSGKSAKMCDASTGKCLWNLQEDKHIQGVIFSADDASVLVYGHAKACNSFIVTCRLVLAQ